MIAMLTTVRKSHLNGGETTEEGLARSAWVVHFQASLQWSKVDTSTFLSVKTDTLEHASHDQAVK